MRADRQFDMSLALVIGGEQKAHSCSVAPLSDGLDLAAEAFSPVDRLRHLDARLVADSSLEIRLPDQRPVDAGRGDFEPIGLGHDVLDVERGRECGAGALTVVDRHRAVGTFRHDLHRRSAGRGDFHPHEPQPEIAQDRRGDAPDA